MSAPCRTRALRLPPVASPLSLAALLLLLAALGPARAEEVKAWENVVVDNLRSGTWRVFLYWKTPQLLTDNDQMTPLLAHPGSKPLTDPARKPFAVTESTAPPENWFSPDFDDATWPRQKGAYGVAESDRTTVWDSANPTELAVICLRGRFEVLEPAACKDLQVSLIYYGGAVVYVNGREVKRQNLPDGDLKPDTYADPYGKDAYIRQELLSIEQFRERTIEYTIKPAALKKGTNLVAVEIHRAPVRKTLEQLMRRNDTVEIPLWSHAFVQKAMIHSGWGLTPKTAYAKYDEPEKIDRKPGTHVLNNSTGYWRVFSRWKTVEMIDDKGEVSSLHFRPGRGETYQAAKPYPVTITPAAPENWAAVDFDDSSWARYRGLLGPAWGFGSDLWTPGNPASLSVLNVRGKFEVKDPDACKDLQVSVEYHGGIVVYVNGIELKRANLPDGPLTPDTLATPYKKPAYVRPDGRLIHCNYDGEAYVDHIRLYRVRTLEEMIPPKMLRKGVNVIALEVHRAPVNEIIATGSYQKLNEQGPPAPWPHALIPTAIVRVAKVMPPDSDGPPGLDPSVVPNLRRPEGTFLWNHCVLERIASEDYPNPCEKIYPIRIAAVRNGAFCGHVAFCSSETVEEMKASITDLKSADAVIAASAVEISFPKQDGDSYEWGLSDRFETLWPEPPAKLEPTLALGGSVQPIWLKVRVPRDARPGTYSATLSVNYLKGIRDINLKPGPPLTVPVELTVNDWALPDPRDYRTFIDLIESPESVAIKYNVPQWSPEHLKYLEKSFRLLAEIGNKAVYLTLITRTHLGNSESMAYFVKQKDGSHTFDFSPMDKYLDLAERVQGKPTVVVLYLWDVYTHEGRAPRVTEIDPEMGAKKEIEAAAYCTPEGKTLWTAFFREIRDRLAKRGLEKAAVIGDIGDWNQPRKDAVAFFKEVAPGIPWVSQCHGLVTRVGDSNTGYSTTVWNALGPGDPALGRSYGWRQDSLICQFHRDLRRGHTLHTYRTAPEWNITGRQRGIGRLGGDFWNVMKKGEKEVLDSRHFAGATIVHRYPTFSDWSQLVVRTAFLACGKDGALSSVQFEMLREGTQDCEARIFVEKALLDKDQRAKLGDDLAARAQKVLDERTWIMANAQRASPWFFATEFVERQNRLYAMTAEVAKALSK